MPIPKSILTDLMRSVPSDQLERICKSSFVRSQSLSSEGYIQKASTPSNACMVILQLARPELEKLAKLVDLESDGLKREPLARKLCYVIKEYDDFLANKGKDTLSPAYLLEMLQKNESMQKILTILSQGVDAGRHSNWPSGNWIAWHCFVCTEVLQDQHANVAVAFAHRTPCWPEPLLPILRQIGANKTADFYMHWAERLLQGTAAKLTGTAVSNYAASVHEQYDNAKQRKLWRESVKAMDENLETVTRQYLLAHPELFSSTPN